MKKRLLFAFMAMCVAVSGFALTNGEYVYTPQGRFQITGDLVAYSNFTDLSGWEVITAAEGKTINDNFTIDANGPVAGTNCAVSLDATAGEGMYFKFTPTSPSNAYVVSFKLKGTASATVRVRGADTVEENIVKVEGNSDAQYAGATDVLLCNTAEQLSDDWQTFNYAIVGDGITRSYFISLTGMQTSVYIADLQIAEALQVADLRARDAAVEKINVYKNAYAWSEDVLAEYGINDALDALNAISDQSAQTDLDEALATADETLTEFLNSNMDDFLAAAPEYTATTNGAGTPKVDNKFNTWFAKVQKAQTWGDWTCVDRGFWEQEAQGAADFGHYAGGSGWAYGNIDNPMGIYTQKDLIAGSYVFGIEGRAAVREKATSSSWANNEGLKVAYAVAYITKVNAEADPDTLASVVKILDPMEYTPFFISANIQEAGTYEIGYKSYCLDEFKSLKNGSVSYIKNVTLYGKNESKYNQKQLAYEADVREQITTGRTQLTDAAANIANAEKPWGKAELQACVDSVEKKIAYYETLSQDDIIATYQDYYEKTTSNDNGLMVYEVYQAGVKDIIAANRKFNAVNDSLATMQSAIDAAENVLVQRIYDAATGKDALKAAIAKAKETQAAMKAAQYSEENVDAIEAANAELADAVETFKTTVPASAYTSVVDIDFTNAAEQDPETLLYKIAGAQGSMEFSSYNAEGATDQTSFEKGFWSNGELLFGDVLRVGNGTGTVIFDPTNGTGSMGTNILKVQFDMYYGNLSGKSAGFYIYNGETEVAGLFISKYSGTEAINTFALDKGLIPAVGSSSAANDAICAESNKTHFEVIFDFGEKSMYCTTDANGKSQTSVKKSFNESAITSFVVKSDYNNSGRRSWFDNLKIEQIQAGATEPFVGIENAKAADAKEAPVKVFENGQIIIGGKYNAAGAVVK